MNIHYLQHVPFEGLGNIEAWALDRQHSLSATRFYDNDRHVGLCQICDGFQPLRIAPPHQ